MAECLPRSNNESTYLVESKRESGGPTNIISKSEDTVVVIGARFQCGDMICDGKIANGPASTLARRQYINILTPSKRKVIISIFHNLEKVPVRRSGAHRHKKSTDPDRFTSKL